MTQHLQALGHRDICYIGNCPLPWYARRNEGYRRAMEEAGLTVRVLVQREMESRRFS